MLLLSVGMEVYEPNGESYEVVVRKAELTLADEKIGAVLTTNCSWKRAIQLEIDGYEAVSMPDIEHRGMLDFRRHLERYSEECYRVAVKLCDTFYCMHHS